MAKPRRRRRWPLAVAALAACLVAAVIAVSNYLVSYALERGDYDDAVTPTTATSAADQAAIDRTKAALDAASAAWTEAVGPQEVSVVSDDDLTLRGSLFESPGSHDWAVVCHGYRGTRADVRNLASFYGERDFNVVTPDLRACGASEGDYVGMGWLDRLDLLRWVDLVLERDPDARIVLHGVSMGGAAVTMCSGEALPPNVAAIVEDCGYTSVWDIFSDELAYLYGLPDVPFLSVASAIAELRAGYGFTEASALDAVSRSRTPLLLIHGTADTFVRPEMAQTLYDACPTRKELLLVEGAGHGDSYKLDPDRYRATLFRFLASCGFDSPAPAVLAAA